MRTNRIANLDDQSDEIISMGYIAGEAFKENFFTLTLNEDDRFQLFFDENAYRAEMTEEFGDELTDEALESDCLFYVESVELAIAEVGGV